jgi:hypothetical protein
MICPDVDTLEALLAGSPGAAPVRPHVESCARCTERAATLALIREPLDEGELRLFERLINAPARLPPVPQHAPPGAWRWALLAAPVALTVVLAFLVGRALLPAPAVEWKGDHRPSLMRVATMTTHLPYEPRRSADAQGLDVERVLNETDPADPRTALVRADAYLLRRGDGDPGRAQDELARLEEGPLRWNEEGVRLWQAGDKEGALRMFTAAGDLPVALFNRAAALEGSPEAIAAWRKYLAVANGSEPAWEAEARDRLQALAP